MPKYLILTMFFTDNPRYCQCKLQSLGQNHKIESQDVSDSQNNIKQLYLDVERNVQRLKGRNISVSLPTGRLNEILSPPFSLSSSLDHLLHAQWVTTVNTTFFGYCYLPGNGIKSQNQNQIQPPKKLLPILVSHLMLLNLLMT